jgi:hypothetical protein
MNGSYLLIAIVFACALLAGMVIALPGAVAASLANHLQLASGRQRILRSLLLVLLVPMMLVAGLLIDKWGVQTLLLIGAMLAALALVLLERGYTKLRPALGAIALLAASGAALLTGSVVAMPHAIFPDNPARSVCLGSLATIVGVLLTPALLRTLVKRLEPRRTVLLLAMVCLVPAACVAVTPTEEVAQPTPSADWTHLFADHHLGLLLLLGLLAFPVEAALTGWTRRYVVEQGYLPGSTAVLGSGFWLMFLAARLATGLFLPNLGETILVIVLALVAAITMGNMLSEYAPGRGGWGLWLTGACFGPLVPAVQGLVLRMYPHDAGPALGLVNAAGALSTLVLVPLMEKSPRSALRWSTILALLLIAPALVLALTG